MTIGTRLRQTRATAGGSQYAFHSADPSLPAAFTFPGAFSAPPIQTTRLIFGSRSGAIFNTSASVLSGPVASTVTGSEADFRMRAVKCAPDSTGKATRVGLRLFNIG